MAKVVKHSDGACWFICPGCGQYHRIPTVHNPAEGKVHPVWGFNGDLEKPTFTPSILTRWTEGEDYKKQVCHSFVKNGKIEFMGDSTHRLAGQTIELPDVTSYSL